MEWWKSIVFMVILVTAFDVNTGQEFRNKMPVKMLQMGERPPPVGATTEWFSGENACEMITAIRISYFYMGPHQMLSCIGFTHKDRENNCAMDSSKHMENFALQKDEFIISVHGNFYGDTINTILFRTNKGRSFGPFGKSPNLRNTNINFSNNGAPLLYVDGIVGQSFVYMLRFFFYYKNVLDQEDMANEVASKVYNAIKGTIMDIYQVQQNYSCMLPSLARQGCYYFAAEQTMGAQMACDINILLDQVNLLTTVSAGLLNHAPRNLLTLKDYDSSKYMDEVQEAHTFHNLLTEIKFGLNAVISVTEKQSAELSAFFQATAQFDKDIAEQDRIYIKGKIEISQQESAKATELAGDKLTQILGVGISVAASNVVDQAFQLGTVILANMNPFKWLFGGPDVDAIYKALEELMSAVRDLIKLSTLMGHLQKFVQYARDISLKLARNQKAIQAMENMVQVLTEETDPAVVQQKSVDFIESYGAYTPQVTSQQIVFVTTLLDAVAGEACSILADMEGFISDVVAGIYESATLDCVYIPADIAVLSSYFEDIYSLQFDMINAITSIVKGHISVTMADRIGAIQKQIDIRTVAIGSAIVETKYQAASLARCDILEYLAAGKRPTICETLLFREDQIQKLISYTGSASSSTRTVFGYIPTTPQEDITIPYINITKFLRGEYQNLKLPMANKGWMKNFGWLPHSYDPETAFYVDSMEMYLPGLKCNQSGEGIHTVLIESLSSNPTYLYSEEAPPKYTVEKYLVKFEYTEPSEYCAANKLSFPVKGHQSSQIQYQKEVCVVSEGMVSPNQKDDFTHPSLFTMWTIRVTGDPRCTLVEDNHLLDFQPMITVRMKISEVFVKKTSSDPGIDECWPVGSRCAPGTFCQNGLLSYSCCQDNQGTCG